MKARQVVIVDYGLGNLFSVKNACEHVGLSAIISSDHTAMASAAAIILPGVGSFGDAMSAINRLDLAAPLRDMASSGKPLIGICLGLQLFMSESSEFGRHRGLGLIEGPVIRFDHPSENGKSLKIPQVGWNRIQRPAGRATAWEDSLLKKISDGAYMYFVHSFYAVPEDSSVVCSVTRYGQLEFCSSVRRGNLFACQFHPERSGWDGLTVYKNLKCDIDRRAE